MSKNIISKRYWYVLLPLLLGTFYLTFLADKIPNFSQVKVPAPLLKKSEVQIRMTQTSNLQSRSIQAQSPQSLSLADALEKSPSLGVLISRNQLIPNTADGFKVKRDLFAIQDWTPELLFSMPTNAMLEVPVVPPLPFTYIGKKLEQGVWEVFLGLGDKTLVVRSESTIENLYRIDEIIPPHMTLTYLPMGVRQSLLIGDF
jgi:hypothetical protein